MTAARNCSSLIRFPIRPTGFALDTPALQRDYDACWQGLPKMFKGYPPGASAPSSMSGKPWQSEVDPGTLCGEIPAPGSGSGSKVPLIVKKSSILPSTAGADAL